MVTQDNAAIISGVLHDNWTLTSPATTDILWATTRVDAAAFLSSGKNYAVGCYNPASPTQVAPLSREVWQQVERVMVDVYVKVVTTQAVAAGTREDMKAEIYRVLHSQELKISGVKDAYVERESSKVEGPDLARLTLQVACVNFHVQQ
jgi:hypothetical protein